MSDAVVIDEVTPAPADNNPQSMQNGLGLEKLIPKKPSPPKDPVTGKFLKADGSKPDPKPAVKGDAKDDKATDPLGQLEKRLKDTRDYATRVDQENKALKDRLKVLEAKIDGTYVEPVGPSPEQQAELERWMERAKTDRQAMFDQYGKDVVEARLFDPESSYAKLEQSDPLIMERLKRAERPVLEAWKIAEKHEFEQKYGSDPTSIKAAIIAEYKQTLTDEINAELKQKRTIDSVATLSHVNGVPRQEAPKAGKGDLDLKKVFPMFPNGTA